MIEVHGWATIRYTAENRDRDDEDALQAAAVNRVRRYIEQLGYEPPNRVPERTVLAPGQSPYSGKLVSAAKHNVVVDLRVLNGHELLWVAGVKNHTTPLAQNMLGLLPTLPRLHRGRMGFCTC